MWYLQSSAGHDCYTLGAWEFKPGLTKKTIRERREVEKEIFENLNFPRELYREWSLRSNKPSFAIRITVALRWQKREGLLATKPRHSVGIRTRIACALTIRTSVHAYFAAELAEWKPSSQRYPFQRFNSESICALLRTSTCRPWSSSAIHSLGIYS